MYSSRIIGKNARSFSGNLTLNLQSQLYKKSFFPVNKCVNFFSTTKNVFPNNDFLSKTIFIYGNHQLASDHINPIHTSILAIIDSNKSNDEEEIKRRLDELDYQISSRYQPNYLWLTKIISFFSWKITNNNELLYERGNKRFHTWFLLLDSYDSSYKKFIVDPNDQFLHDEVMKNFIMIVFFLNFRQLGQNFPR